MRAFQATIIVATAVLSVATLANKTAAVAPISQRQARTPLGAELPPNALRLPPVYQSTDYSCGAAALLSVLSYWGIQKLERGELSETLLMEELGTTHDDGTNPKKIAEVAKKYLPRVTLQENTTLDQLRTHLAQGETPILSLQAWKDEKNRNTPWKDVWDDGHYVVLIALDAAYAYVMDSVSPFRYGYIPLPELEERWHDVEKEPAGEWRHSHLAIFIGSDKPTPFDPGRLLAIP